MVSKLFRFHRDRDEKPAEDSPEQVIQSTGPMDEEKQDATTGTAPYSDPDASSTEHPQESLQRGVAQVEATTLTWTKPMLIITFILMFLLYFVNAFQSTVLSNLTPYVTSAWESHSLLTVISVVANAMTAAMYIPMAKILDLWGRAEGFALMTGFATLGLILMACSNNLPVYCAAQVFYSIGFAGMTYSIDVITADVTKLKNRGLAYAFTSSPYMITAFAGGAASQDFYDNIGWRWGFGVFAIILPVVAAPLYIVLKMNLRKAANVGVLKREPSGRTVLQSIWFYTVEFDALGVSLFSIGLTVFLLPFTLASYAPDGWKSGYIIAMIIVGFFLLAFFAAYEIYLAPKPLLNWDMLSDRTILGSCLLQGCYQISYYCWDSYFTSFLQVVNNVSIAEAGYINNTFNVVSGFLLFCVGWSIRRTGYFKWLLYVAVPLYVFTQGLMIYFRRPNQSVGYQVMCQIFISIAGSIFIIVNQLSILAAVDHQHVAAALSLLSVVGTTGDAIGNTVSGAIWTNTFYKALERNLPAKVMSNIDTIYDDLDTQLSYAVGTPARLAIQKAYAYAQTRMLSAGVAFIALTIIFVFMIKNINVSKLSQTKGMIF